MFFGANAHGLSYKHIEYLHPFIKISRNQSYMLRII